MLLGYFNIHRIVPPVRLPMFKEKWSIGTLAESGAPVEGKIPTQTLDPTSQELLRGRYIAALGTENADGTIHLT